MLEYIDPHALGFQQLYDAGSASLASMAGSLTYRQSMDAVADVGMVGDEHTSMDYLTLSHLVSDRKRAASTDTGDESPTKRNVQLPGLYELNLLPPRPLDE